MIAFAYYRLPYLHHATYVAQHEGEPEVLSSVAELNGKEGFVAGVNAARKLREESPFILSRAESYIGTLIDDLVTKGTNVSLYFTWLQ